MLLVLRMGNRHTAIPRLFSVILTLFFYPYDKTSGGPNSSPNPLGGDYEILPLKRTP